MKEINQDTNDHVYNYVTKRKMSIYIDGFELVSVAAELDSVQGDKDPSRDDIIKVTKQLCWFDEGVKLEDFTDHELFTAGTNVLLEIKKLGNE